MRKFLFIIAVLVAIILSLPYFMGLVAKNKIEQITATINSFAPIKIKLVSYDNGWFCSNAKAIITLKHTFTTEEHNNTKSEPTQINISAKIFHGPIIYQSQQFKLVQALIEAKVEPTPEQQAKLQQITKTIASISLQININGNSIIQLNSAPLIYQNQQRKLEWQGMHLEMFLSHTQDKLIYSAYIPGIDLYLENFALHLTGFQSYFNGSRDPEQLWIGEQKMKAQTFSIKTPELANLAASNLNVTFNSANEKNGVALNVCETVDELDIFGTKYKNNKLVFSAKGLNKKLLAKAYKHLDQYYLNWKQKMQLAKTLLDLVSSGGSFNLQELQTLTPWGKLALKVNLETLLQGGDTSFLALLANSNLSLEIAAEQKLALQFLEHFYRSKNPPPKDPQKEAAEALATWQQSGKILLRDNNLILNLNYNNNSLTFNSRQLNTGTGNPQ